MSRRVLPRRFGICAALLFAALLVLDGSAGAREARPKPEARRVKTSVSKKVYQSLSAAHEALSAERYDDALRSLERIRAMSKLSDYEKARMWQTYAYVYAGQEHYDKALDAFERCLATGGLPQAESQRILYNVGQLYIANEQYAKGVKTLEEWFRSAESPAPEPYFLMANAYYQMQKPDTSLQWAERGLARAEEPREGWLQLALALYFEKGRHDKCAEVLEQLLRRFPKKQYWRQLAGIYGELGREKDQLAAYELAHRQGLLTTSNERIQMAQLFLYHNVPYKAAKLLEAGLRSGEIESSADHWELLANAWIQAREYERAQEPLRRAASLSKDGDLYLRLAQVHFENEDWKAALTAIHAAFDKGKITDRGQAYLLLGIASFNTGQRSVSAEAFASAAKYERTRKSANEWLRHLEQTQDHPS